MVKNFAPSINNHVVGENTSLATCWRVSRNDGSVQGFTNHDQDIVIGGLTYKANTGFTATAFEQDNTLAVRNLDIESVLDDEGISESDLAGGEYDFATVEIFLTRWDNPPSSLSLDPPEHILMVKGVTGEISMTNLRYRAEIRSFSQLLQQRISTLTTKECRAVFGDSKCTKDLSGLTDNIEITSVTSKRQFTVNTGRADGFYNLGQITFTSGDNNGNQAMVLDLTGGVIQLFESMPYTPQIGDTLTAVAGCAKTIDACKGYSNILNYQGEPFIPGEDKLLAGFEG